METDPTPYDIMPIPIFGFEPGLFLWLMVFLLLGLSLLVFLYNRSSRIPKRRARAIEIAETSIRELSATAPESLTRLSFLSRRLAASLTNEAAMTLSASELQQAAERQSNESVRQLFLLLSDFESERYAPYSKQQFLERRQSMLKLIQKLREEQQ